jgi:CheY-like chemotaxis protein
VPLALLCDDATGFRLMLSMTLRDEGWDVKEASDWRSAIDQAAQHQPAAVLADLWMPNPDLEALAQLRQAAPEAHLTVMSSLDLEQVREIVADVDGIDLVVSKRQSPADIAAAVTIGRSSA